MIYVLDASVFRPLGHYYPKQFPSLWAGLEKLIDAESLVSTREVKRELANLVHVPFLLDWIKNHKTLFATPDNDQLKIVAEILKVPHFQSLIKQKNIWQGAPAADPFVIAAAKALAGTVVSEEKFKPHAAKIPNVCKHLEVPCINLEGLMDAQGWSF